MDHQLAERPLEPELSERPLEPELSEQDRGEALVVRCGVITLGPVVGRRRARY